MGLITKFSASDDKQNAETTIIASRASLNGILNFESLLHVHGKVNGYINSTNTVVICKDGVVSGEIRAKRVVINGNFVGSIDCEIIDILEGGRFEGVVRYDSLSIEKDAFFEGKSVKK